MAIVPAGVHSTGVCRFVGLGSKLLEGQGIHVSAQADLLCSVPPTADLGNDTRAGYTPVLKDPLIGARQSRPTALSRFISGRERLS